ncbi:hypothetical protein PIB30_071758 [Stylosanthes scabra]|uniref:Uncharacterized protein n=1 Tax=Stylosanthes scabra TaxID=79078 RepID=A0ABU6UML3_9FABA|nr:hypothetical protein [Stylosanthes scabra]
MIIHEHKHTSYLHPGFSFVLKTCRMSLFTPYLQSSSLLYVVEQGLRNDLELQEAMEVGEDKSPSSHSPLLHLLMCSWWLMQPLVSITPLKGFFILKQKGKNVPKI